MQQIGNPIKYVKPHNNDVKLTPDNGSHSPTPVYAQQTEMTTMHHVRDSLEQHAENDEERLVSWAFTIPARLLLCVTPRECMC